MLPDALSELGCLPLAERDIALPAAGAALSAGTDPRRGDGAVAFKVVPIAVAFFAAAVALLLTKSLTLREAYETIEWPILDPAGGADPGERSGAHDRRRPTLSRAGWHAAAARCRRSARSA